MLDAPRHLLLFDPRSIRTLGDKAGLRPTRLSTSAGARQLWGSHHYKHAQGVDLPQDLEERRELIAGTQSAPKRRGLKRLLVRLVSFVASIFRCGEALEVEFVRL